MTAYCSALASLSTNYIYFSTKYSIVQRKLNTQQFCITKQCRTVVHNTEIMKEKNMRISTSSCRIIKRTFVSAAVRTLTACWSL